MQNVNLARADLAFQRLLHARPYDTSGHAAPSWWPCSAWMACRRRTSRRRAFRGRPSPVVARLGAHRPTVWSVFWGWLVGRISLRWAGGGRPHQARIPGVVHSPEGRRSGFGSRRIVAHPKTHGHHVFASFQQNSMASWPVHSRSRSLVGRPYSVSFPCPFGSLRRRSPEKAFIETHIGPRAVAPAWCAEHSCAMPFCRGFAQYTTCASVHRPRHTSSPPPVLIARSCSHHFLYTFRPGVLHSLFRSCLRDACAPSSPT